MRIELTDLGKRFNNQWVFRYLNYKFIQGERYAILGSNGSGKSTLLQTIAGYRMPSEGTIHYTLNTKPVDANHHYQHISFAAPYLELIEEYNIEELFQLHFSLKPIIQGLTFSGFLSLLQLQQISKKTINQYSSGMKQRLRLALAFCTKTEVLLLDEPCSNLDASGIDWYQKLLRTHTLNRLSIICSNHQGYEYQPCENIIDIDCSKKPASVKSR